MFWEGFITFKSFFILQSFVLPDEDLFAPTEWEIQVTRKKVARHRYIIYDIYGKYKYKYGFQMSYFYVIIFKI